MAKINKTVVSVQNTELIKLTTNLKGGGNYATNR